MSTMKKNIASWLYKQVDIFKGLTWSDKGENCVEIVWEKKGKPGSEETLEICKVKLNFIFS